MKMAVATTNGVMEETVGHGLTGADETYLPVRANVTDRHADAFAAPVTVVVVTAKKMVNTMQSTRALTVSSGLSRGTLVALVPYHKNIPMAMVPSVASCRIIQVSLFPYCCRVLGEKPRRHFAHCLPFDHPKAVFSSTDSCKERPFFVEERVNDGQGLSATLRPTPSCRIAVVRAPNCPSPKAKKVARTSPFECAQLLGVDLLLLIRDAILWPCSRVWRLQVVS